MDGKLGDVTAVRHAHPAAPYRPAPDTYDEALTAAGAWRPSAGALLSALDGRAPGELAAGVVAATERHGVTFGGDDGDTFVVDPVPRVIDATEWQRLERGVAQRTLALDAFVADVYGPRRSVAEGVVPARVVDGAGNHEPAARDVPPPGGVWVGVSGLDIVRDERGTLRVLEDNVRTPSGIAYTMAVRRVIAEAVVAPPHEVRSVDGAAALLAATLRGAAPERARRDPFAVVLTDGRASSAFWEHAQLATALDAPLVTIADLRSDGAELTLGSRRVDVVYRRTDDAGLDAPAGRLLAGPLAAGTLGIVNGFGTGVADDKLVHGYVEDLIRFFLGEEPVLESVRTLDLAHPAHLEEALDRLGELVVKPRGGSGGAGVVLGPRASTAELDRLRAALLARPEELIAQEFVRLSTHPTVVAGTLAPRHVDLRPFAFVTAPGEAHVLPGGLTRVALGEGDMVVNSSRDGGAKDTWVLAT